MSTDSVLVATFKQAMVIWDAQKAEGVPISARIANLSASLKHAWPITREWHYVCKSCDDYGLVIEDCPGDASCGRPKAHLPHDNGRPCWCPAGNKFKGKVKPEPHDFQRAGKITKPSRIGR